jgi:hypothetical protein
MFEIKVSDIQPLLQYLTDDQINMLTTILQAEKTARSKK